MSTLDNQPWWDCDKSKPPHERLIPLVKSMQNSQAQRYANMRRMTAVYAYGFKASESNNDLNAIDDAKLHFNVAKNAMDTMHAQVCTPRIAPMLLTEGGTKGQRDRAKMATKAVEGVFGENDVEEIKEDVVLDAQLSYCGFAQVEPEVHGKDGDRWADIKIHRVNPRDIYVDTAEGRDRKPRCMYRRHLRDRYVLLAEYGKPDADLYGSAKTRSDKIRKLQSGPSDVVEPMSARNADQIEVWEAWHLPSGCEEDGEGSTDGLHVIAIDGCTLFVEPWDRPRFPISVYRPEKDREGYWGLAAMRQAMSGQREYEEVTAKLQRAHKKMGSSSLVVYGNAGETVNSRELGNGQGQIINVAGPPGSVTPLTPSPANAQTYQYREGIASDLLRYLGLSEYAAQSEIPAGMSQASGKALQLVEDSESKRGILRHRSIERFIVDLADLVIDEARALIKRGIRVTSRYRSKTGFEPIDWKEIVEVIEDRKGYVVTTFPVGMLAQTPGAKFAQLDALLDRGVITIEQFKRLFEIPDLEAENAVDTADSEIIDKNVDHMVTTGRYVSPQSFDALDLIILRGGKLYNAYRLAEVPDARLELVRRYITDAKALQDEAKSKAAAMASGPPGMPMRPDQAPPMPPDPMMPPPMPPMGAPPGPDQMPPPPGMAA